jgi:hypothetical protein
MPDNSGSGDGNGGTNGNGGSGGSDGTQATQYNRIDLHKVDLPKLIPLRHDNFDPFCNQLMAILTLNGLDHVLEQVVGPGEVGYKAILPEHDRYVKALIQAAVTGEDAHIVSKAQSAKKAIDALRQDRFGAEQAQVASLTAQFWSGEKVSDFIERKRACRRKLEELGEKVLDNHLGLVILNGVKHLKDYENTREAIISSGDLSMENVKKKLMLKEKLLAESKAGSSVNGSARMDEGEADGAALFTMGGGFRENQMGYNSGGYFKPGNRGGRGRSNFKVRGGIQKRVERHGDSQFATRGRGNRMRGGRGGG